MTKFEIKNGTCVIPEGVTRIVHNTFSGCSELTTVVLPLSLKTIGEKSFYDCINLKKIIYSQSLFEIPPALTKIGEKAFENCNHLSVFFLPPYIIEIEDYAFKGCSELCNIHLPSSLRRIGKSAFENCVKISALPINA